MLLSIEDICTEPHLSQSFDLGRSWTLLDSFILMPFHIYKCSNDDSFHINDCPNDDSVTISNCNTYKQSFQNTKDFFTEIFARINNNSREDFTSSALQAVKCYNIPIATNDISLNFRI
jgi:hypothetical protein